MLEVGSTNGVGGKVAENGRQTSRSPQTCPTHFASVTLNNLQCSIEIYFKLFSYTTVADIFRRIAYSLALKKVAKLLRNIQR